MSTTYRTRNGDTFESISRKIYGVETYANLVQAANPGAQEPFISGAVLEVPSRPDEVPVRPTEALSAGDNEVAILIDGVRFRYWSSVDLRRSLDGVDAITFTAPFDSESAFFKEVFRPFAYKTLEVTIGGSFAFRGTLVTVAPSVTKDQRSITVEGYSTAGVLNDCNAPASMYPIEFNETGLPDIAARLCEPFGVQTVLPLDSGSAFERVALPPGEKVLQFLRKLANQRGLVAATDGEGRLIFQQAAEAGSPVAVLDEGASPVVSVSASFSPQSYYSHITALEPMLVGLDGSSYTVSNPHLGKLRPHTFAATDVNGGALQIAAENKAGRMFGNMASYSVLLNTWRDPAGLLWSPNTTLKLFAPGAMVYAPYEFLIRSVVLSRSASGETAALELCLPGSFSNQTPESLPWDG